MTDVTHDPACTRASLQHAVGSLGGKLRLPAGDDPPRPACGTANAETRTFLLDGDDLIDRAHCHAPDHVAIGFGACHGPVNAT